MPAPWPAPGWEPVEPFPFQEAGHPFTGLSRDADFLGLRYFLRPEGDLAAVASFGRLSEGAPGHAHGGAILTALDEALGAAAWVAGHPVLTSRLAADFKKSVPLGAQLLVETKTKRARHRVVEVSGRLVGADGTVYACAEGRFFELDADGQRRYFSRVSAPSVRTRPAPGSSK